MELSQFWIPVEDEPGLICRYESADGRLRMGVYRVLFGWRVRGGFVHRPLEYRLDWCCGADHRILRWAFSMMQQILFDQRDLADPFAGIPEQCDPKPMGRNIRFLVQLSGLAQLPPEQQFQLFPLPSFEELARRAPEVDLFFGALKHAAEQSS